MSELSRPNLRVGVVGAGRAGSVIGAALRAAGHEIVATSAVSEASRQRAEELLPGVPIASVQEVVSDADVVILGVPDDAIEPLANGLAAENLWGPGKLVIHLSGFHGVDALAAVTTVGGDAIALHPVMTFSGTPADLDRLPGTPFAITASAGVGVVAEALVLDLGGLPVAIAEGDRAAYHAALAHAANHLVTVIAQSEQVLREIGVEDPGRFIAPLVEAATANALERGDRALTGPVSRGDVGTVRAHLDALAQHSPDIEPAYRALAEATLERAALRRAMPAEAVLPLRQLLTGRD
ncbi:putative short-subunit dehydrogenase-like oxidoreductase (DUF2520 family) [Branchiibius hedensis]|uniref:Predicted oxidoreductase, contains short-chain dehydrogenase (SDR) and DUF2520 domains n=1 Tax=Branchiibius hedensis TaxID=672460 RepID=A0A2Y8ZM09_9MICO|nr:DUF2520 domain-containing protein [Branchiibius hedensis]PWJ23986.1 putative short-subunit dehydrogenase-like oxidoreductase (DUF2520 family) [Branchiibius hedensis]SSA32804.1 Predicted oxidoreductase, contains short-chain dehydrogenase (SDR) and DUF2520 domains [Branchiibius hedensis]